MLIEWLGLLLREDDEFDTVEWGEAFPRLPGVVVAGPAALRLLVLVVVVVALLVLFGAGRKGLGCMLPGTRLD